MVKRNVNFPAKESTIEDFDKTLEEYEKVTGLSLKKGNCMEIALKEYIEKLRKQIEILKTNKE